MNGTLCKKEASGNVMDEEKKTHEAEKRAAEHPRIRSEYSYLFEDNDEDPYEQIFRRVEEKEESHTGGIPADKDRAVDKLFEDPDDADEDQEIWTLSDALKKIPLLLRRKPAKAQPAMEESTTAEPAEAETTAQEQEAAPMPEDVTAPAIPVEEEMSADEEIIVFEPVKPKFTVTLPKEEVQETPEAPANEPEPVKPKFTVTLPEDQPPAPEEPKVIVAEEIMDNDEPIIVFEPVRSAAPVMPESPDTTSATETPDAAAPEDMFELTKPSFVPVMPEDLPGEPEAAPTEAVGEGETTVYPVQPEEPQTEEAPKEFLAAELVEENELMFKFRVKKKPTEIPVEEPVEEAPVTAFVPEEPVEEAPVTAFVPEEPVEEAPVAAFVPEEPVEEAPVTAFVPEEPVEEAPVAAFVPEEPVEEAPVTAFVPEEPVEEVPAEEPVPTSWNVKVAIPEEIKDVEGKLKNIPVEELPISIFTEPTPAVEAPVPEEAPAPAEEMPSENPVVEPVPEESAAEPMEPAEEAAQLPEEPARPICVKWSEEMFRPHRGREIVARSKERLYAPVEGVYRELVAPVRRKKKQAIQQQKRREKTEQLKRITAAKATQVKDCTVACVKKTAYCLRPDVVYGALKHVVTGTAETGTYKASAILQLIAAGLGGVLLMALLIINRFDIATPMELSQYEMPVRFAMIHAITLGAVMLLSFRTMVGGIVSGFTRHCDRGTDSTICLLSALCLTQSILSIFFYEEILQGRVSLYAPVCVLVLFLDAWGKLVNYRRVNRILRVLDDASGAECAGILQEDTELQTRVDANVPERLTAVRGQRVDRAAFIRNAVQRDSSQKALRMMILPLLVVSVLIGVLAYTVDASWMSALAACTATLCVCVPVSLSLCMTVPAVRGGKCIEKYGAAVASWESVACFGEVSCVVVRDEDLYPERTVKLVNVKVLKEAMLETTIVSAAAVLHQVGGPLCGVVDRILTGEVDTMPTAERVQVDENGGAVGWVGGRRILIGKGDLLQKYNIQAPSRDYEHKICPEGRQLVYLASGSELVAVFILEYLVDAELRKTMQALSDTGCDLAVCTADAVLTPAFLANRFGLDVEGVEVIRITARPEESAVEEEQQHQLVMTRGSASLFAGLKTCIRMKGAMELASALQIAGILLGILLMVVFAATGAIYQVSNFVLTLFELFWLTAVLLIPALKRM